MRPVTSRGETGSAGSVIADRAPVPFRCAVAALSRCVARAFLLLARRRLHQPTDRLGTVLAFGDGSRGRVYRETVVDHLGVDDPAVLVVAFCLRAVRGPRGHALFRAESLLNTPLFVGFPGFVSKLWVAPEGGGTYRGVYQWDGAARADAYVRALWWVLALVCVRGSIHYAVVPGLRRNDVLADPHLLDLVPTAPGRWWRLIAVAPGAA